MPSVEAFQGGSNCAVRTWSHNFGCRNTDSMLSWNVSHFFSAKAFNFPSDGCLLSSIASRYASARVSTAVEVFQLDAAQMIACIFVAVVFMETGVGDIRCDRRSGDGTRQGEAI